MCCCSCSRCSGLLLQFLDLLVLFSNLLFEELDLALSVHVLHLELLELAVLALALCLALLKECLGFVVLFLQLVVGLCSSRRLLLVLLKLLLELGRFVVCGLQLRLDVRKLLLLLVRRQCTVCCQSLGACKLHLERGQLLVLLLGALLALLETGLELFDLLCVVLGLGVHLLDLLVCCRDVLLLLLHESVGVVHLPLGVLQLLLGCCRSFLRTGSVLFRLLLELGDGLVLGLALRLKLRHLCVHRLDLGSHALGLGRALGVLCLALLHLVLQSLDRLLLRGQCRLRLRKLGEAVVRRALGELLRRGEFVPQLLELRLLLLQRGLGLLGCLAGRLLRLGALFLLLLDLLLELGDLLLLLLHGLGGLGVLLVRVLQLLADALRLALLRLDLGLRLAHLGLHLGDAGRAGLGPVLRLAHAPVQLGELVLLGLLGRLDLGELLLRLLQLLLALLRQLLVGLLGRPEPLPRLLQLVLLRPHLLLQLADGLLVLGVLGGRGRSGSGRRSSARGLQLLVLGLELGDLLLRDHLLHLLLLLLHGLLRLRELLLLALDGVLRLRELGALRVGRGRRLLLGLPEPLFRLRELLLLLRGGLLELADALRGLGLLRSSRGRQRGRLGVELVELGAQLVDLLLRDHLLQLGLLLLQVLLEPRDAFLQLRRLVLRRRIAPLLLLLLLLQRGDRRLLLVALLRHVLELALQLRELLALVLSSRSCRRRGRRSRIALAASRPCCCSSRSIARGRSGGLLGV